MKSKKKVVIQRTKVVQKKKPQVSEKSLLQKLGAMALRGGGAGIGYAAGNASAGYKAGANFSKFLGFGDYTVTENSLVKRASSGIPVMHSSNMSTVIRHREFLGDVISSATAKAFSIQQYPLNPGISTTFPWLSTVAQQYQEYSFRGVVFEFISTSGNALNSTNTALGSVMMATQYRSTASAFTNKLALLNEYYSTDAKPSDDFVHAIECDPKENPFQIQYVRNQPLIAGEDEKMYDLGTFSIASVGLQGTSVNVGELWVSYEVELKKPQLSNFTGLLASHFTLAGAYAGGTPLGTAAAGVAFDNIGVTVDYAARSIIFPSGIAANFCVTVVYGGCTIMGGATGFSFGTGASSLNIYRGAGSVNTNASTAGGFTTVTQFVTIVNTGSPVVITMNTLSSIIATAGDVYITQLTKDIA